MLLKIEYFYIVIFMLVASVVVLLMFIASYLLSPRHVDLEKLTPYECGFEPFEDTRDVFDVHFYLVSILFIIFDLELIFVFPWALNLAVLSISGFISMFLFLLILALGFIYELKKGALDWSNTG